MAVKSVKKYTAAILIVCILWFLIGFTFAQRYLEANLAGCLLAALISVTIIIQVERQIILSVNPGKLLVLSRSCLALIMSIIGAVVIDQILLEKDIELEKISYISERVDKILPSKTSELKKQIMELDETINKKEAEVKSLRADIDKRPHVPSETITTTAVKVPVKTVTASGKDTIIFKNEIQITSQRVNVANPKIALIGPMDSTINAMRQQKAVKENDLLHIKPALEKEFKESNGFLDELKVMKQLISNSTVALCFWLIWMLFFFFIEMLVLLSKMGDKASDYEKVILHQMDIQNRRLDVLAKGM